MTPSKTPFAGFERLAPGDPLSSDGYAFTYENPYIADKLAKIGAVTHRHDAHAAMPDPTVDPTVSVTATGGVIPSDTSIYIVYTLFDSSAGETLPSPVVTVSTGSGYVAPGAPTATVDYTAGTLMAGNPVYAITVSDGAGGETELGAVVSVTINPGHANAQVLLSGLTALTDAASGSSTSAMWRMWRSMDGGSTWDLLGTGLYSTDTFTDSGAGGDCTQSPPYDGTTLGTSQISVTVPSAGQPAGVTLFSIYADTTGQFLVPCLLGTYPVSDFDVAQTFTALAPLMGQPPSVSQSYPGASQINPDTDIVNWYWKAPVDTAFDLPTDGNNDGDARIARDTDQIWIWDATDAVWNQWNPGGGVLTSSQHVGSYTLAKTDSGSVIEFLGATAQTLTIEPNATVAMPVGCVVEVFQYGAGQVTVAGAAGVTLRSDGAHVNTAAQYSTISLRQRDVDEWVLSGDLA
jgi:hypothetical protein